MNTPYYNSYIYIYKNILLLCVLVILSPYNILYAQSEERLANEYISKGEKEKALAIYENLIQQNKKTPEVHNNYLNLMLSMGNYDGAEEYVKKCIKKEPDKLSYKLDLGLVFIKSGRERKAEKIINSAVEKNIYSAPLVTNYFMSHRLFDYAIKNIERTRKKLSNPTLYAFDMGTLYRIKNNKKGMIREYLNYVVNNNKNNADYVKGIFQRVLTEKKDLETLETTLYEGAQKNPESEVYLDFLIWTSLQRKDFYGAYTQAKSYDRRFKKGESRVLEIAEIALSNKDFKNAERGFSYIINQSPKKEEEIRARLGLIHAHAEKIKNNLSVNKDSVMFLVKEYELLLQKYPNNPQVQKNKLSQAQLYAYELDKKEEAIAILQTLLTNGNTIPPLLKAEVKLELGKIYMLKKEPWEAILLYAQVAHEQGDTPIGYEAKLRTSKLYYYKGDFDLAQEYLNILKEATTRRIANDAMELSLRIKENILADSTGKRLKEYAAIELLLEEKKIDQALEKITRLKKNGEDSIEYSDQRVILDDIYWLEANIRMQRAEWDKAYALLQKIVTNFGDDVLSDDALFFQGDIMEKHKNDKAGAMALYLQFISRFPGSVYVAEARQRYRKLQQEIAAP